MTACDPNRLDRMIELLHEVWQHVPDWRLTQLVINAADTTHDCGPLFQLEDTQMETKLHELVRSLDRQRRDDPPPLCSEDFAPSQTTFQLDKSQRLAAAGFQMGDAADFLNLSEEEQRIVEERVSMSKAKLNKQQTTNKSHKMRKPNP